MKGADANVLRPAMTLVEKRLYRIRPAGAASAVATRSTTLDCGFLQPPRRRGSSPIRQTAPAAASSHSPSAPGSSSRPLCGDAQQALSPVLDRRPRRERVELRERSRVAVRPREHPGRHGSQHQRVPHDQPPPSRGGGRRTPTPPGPRPRRSRCSACQAREHRGEPERHPPIHRPGSSSARTSASVDATRRNTQQAVRASLGRETHGERAEREKSRSQETGPPADWTRPEQGRERDQRRTEHERWHAQPNHGIADLCGGPGDDEEERRGVLVRAHPRERLAQRPVHHVVVGESFVAEEAVAHAPDPQGEGDERERRAPRGSSGGRASIRPSSTPGRHVVLCAGRQPAPTALHAREPRAVGCEEDDVAGLCRFSAPRARAAAWPGAESGDCSRRRTRTG